MHHCPNCRLRVKPAVKYCPKCSRTLLAAVPQHQRFSRPPADPLRSSRKSRSSTRSRAFRAVVVTVLRLMGQKTNVGQALVVLALGSLMMLVVVFSAIKGGGGEKYQGEHGEQGELRSKTLMYESDGSGNLELYWRD